MDQITIHSGISAHRLRSRLGCQKLAEIPHRGRRNQKLLRILAVSLLFLGSVLELLSSEETGHDWKAIDITAEPMRPSGTVRIQAQLKDKEVASMTLSAFGREYALKDSELKQLSGINLMGLWITSEVGYAETGGPTVHFKFISGGYNSSGEMIEDTTVISLSRDAELRINRWKEPLKK